MGLERLSFTQPGMFCLWLSITSGTATLRRPTYALMHGAIAIEPRCPGPKLAAPVAVALELPVALPRRA